MKFLVATIFALATFTAHAGEGAYNIGYWIDSGLEESFAAYESSGDLKAFCSTAFYKDGKADQIFEISASGEFLSCKLNHEQSLPLGKNCEQGGKISGDKLTIKFADGTVSFAMLSEKEPGHLFFSLPLPSNDAGILLQEEWDLLRLTDARVASLSYAFQRCIAGP